MLNHLSLRAGLIALAALSLSTPSLAAVKREFLDLKLPTQVMLERQLIVDAEASNTAGVLSPNQGPTSAAVATITSGFTAPGVPRNLLIYPSATYTSIGTCTITVTGTNFFGDTITEDFAFAANTTASTTGTKAFKTVTSLSFAADCEDGAFDTKWSVGVGEKLGLKRCMDVAGNLAWATASGVYEATRPTCVADADEVEKNTCDVNATMDGSADFQLMFFQNYRCQP